MVKDQEFLEKKASYCIGLAKKFGATESSVMVNNSVSETVNFRNITHKVAGRQHSSGFLDTLDPVELERAVNEYDPFFKALYKDDQKTYDQLQDLLKISVGRP